MKAANVRVLLATCYAIAAVADSSSFLGRWPSHPSPLDNVAESNCPNDRGVTGYLLVHEGAWMHTSVHGLTGDLQGCKKLCDAMPGCSAFTFHARRKANSSDCLLSEGSEPNPDKLSNAYYRCPDFGKCPNDHGLKGYKFSHQGWWTGMERVRNKVYNHKMCAAACNEKSECTAFSFRNSKVKQGIKPQCFHYSGNKPVRDRGSLAFARCAENKEMILKRQHRQLARTSHELDELDEENEQERGDDEDEEAISQ